MKGAGCEASSLFINLSIVNHQFKVEGFDIGLMYN
jgi:hypothetical protein